MAASNSLNVDIEMIEQQWPAQPQMPKLPAFVPGIDDYFIDMHEDHSQFLTNREFDLAVDRRTQSLSKYRMLHNGGKLIENNGIVVRVPSNIRVQGEIIPTPLVQTAIFPATSTGANFCTSSNVAKDVDIYMDRGVIEGPAGLKTSDFLNRPHQDICVVVQTSTAQNSPLKTQITGERVIQVSRRVILNANLHCLTYAVCGKADYPVIHMGNALAIQRMIGVFHPMHRDFLIDLLDCIRNKVKHPERLTWRTFNLLLDSLYECRYKVNSHCQTVNLGGTISPLN
jgi:hypothetical protein